MIPSKLYSPVIAEILGELAEQGVCDLSPTLQKLYNELMKMEREEVLQAGPYERTEQRQGYANGFKDKKLQTRFGTLELKVPQTRGIEFYPQSLEKGQRSERALKLAIAQMYVEGVSTRRMRRVTKELCGLDLSSSQVSRLCKVLDEELTPFWERPLGECRYVYLDARYEKVRHQGHVRSLAVLTAIGVSPDGYREVIGVSVSLSEAEVHWRQFLESLRERGLCGIEVIISDAHPGLRAAFSAVFPSAAWQACLFHLAQNAQSYAPNHQMRNELSQAVRAIYQAPNIEEAEERLRRTVSRYSAKAGRFCDWLEERFREGLTFYQFPESHWKKLRTNNISERLNQEIKRRTRVARLFPDEASCLRLISAVVMEVHEEWMSGRRYLTFE